ncbi:helicostatins [Phlebotomus argentipes]|uniref:helicostatins n=1 Tax=Phlebotomus argentipes TaxID=94469 RepID=UPI002892BAE7|nr:helicostatins [Phlebotomus argentipes]
MRPILIPLFLLGGFCVAVFATSDALNDREDFNLNALLQPSGPGNAIPLRDLETLVDKKADRYVFGLGRRSDPYASAAESSGGTIKRLPMYNFGLGKRARPYAFGLGKRSGGDEEEYQDAVDAYESWPMMYPVAEKPDALDIKRGRPYSFGLGKRYIMTKNAEPVERRSASRYNFGLGKR